MTEVTKFLLFSGFGFVLGIIVTRWWRERNRKIFEREFNKLPRPKEEHFCLEKQEVIPGFGSDCPDCKAYFEKIEKL